MQTFLPYPDFAKSASVLDRARLVNQRLEVLQLLKALTGKSTGWVNHPAAKMWRGHEIALCDYGLWVVAVWSERGYKDTCGDKIRAILKELYETRPFVPKRDRKPKWLGDEAFHASHRSNLLRKDKEYYSQFGWTEPDNLPYIWPTNDIT